PLILWPQNSFGLPEGTLIIAGYVSKVSPYTITTTGSCSPAQNAINSVYKTAKCFSKGIHHCLCRIANRRIISWHCLLWPCVTNGHIVIDSHSLTLLILYFQKHQSSLFHSTILVNPNLYQTP